MRTRLKADAVGAARLLGLVPPHVWVAITVVVSTVVYANAGRAVGAPAVFADELIHSDLAKSIASGTAPSVRGEVTLSYGVVSQIVGAVAYALGGDPVAGYSLLKAFNAFAMSLAAVPAFLLARRVVTPGWAVVVSVLTVAVPSMALSSLVMTEPVFYTVFLSVVAALTRTLERPTYTRQAVLVSLVGFACLTRSQALAFIPAVAAAIVLFAWFERLGAARDVPMRVTLGRYRLLWAVLLGVIGCVTVVGVVRASPSQMLGAYSVLAQWYSPVSTIRWSIANLADLSLYVGVVGLASLPLGLVAALDRSTSTAASRAWAASTLAVGVAMLGMVGAFSGSSVGGEALHDRYAFYLVPLLVTGLVLWVRSGLPRPRVVVAVSCTVVVLLPLTIPYGDALSDAWVDHVALLPWTAVTDSVDTALPSMLVASLVGAALVAFVPPRHAWVLLLVVASSFWLAGTAAGWEAEGKGAYAERVPGWIDGALEPGAVVGLVHVEPRRCEALGVPGHRWLTYWRAEFFNERIGPVVTIGGSADTSVAIRADGTLVGAGSRDLRIPYVVTDARVPLLDATPIAASEAEGLTLWKVGGVVRLALSSESQVERRLCSPLRA